ncbi:S8 family serine peptidase [Bradyrhizobium sp. dw_411]|uniref:S8 family serine peptidase n=1 Tax=Bradyrhizobium sp. dw_411 TaxID=2720082 RepID=UPI00201C1990|nr:S8 family serine peptidase [Bradyrhizobium sp. dw_411]
MRSPSINIQSRLPTITPTVVAPRIDPNIVGRGADIGSGRNIPSLRSACTAAERDSGECSGQSANATGGGGSGHGTAKNRSAGSRGNTLQTALDQRGIANELVAEIDGSLSDTQADELARRHGLTRLQSQNFPLIGSTIGLFRVTNRRAVDTVSREFATEAGVRSVQPNFRYVLQEQKTELTEGDPAQYAVAKLHLPQAHTLAHGANVTVAVIDSGIDINHPELANSIAASFDALGSKEGPHVHGTGIAGAIVAHARLIGSAPAARILAIRAFGVASNGAESSSYVILRGLDYAVAHGAQIINMSFAGPKDALIERGVAAIAGKGIVMVAAAGNAGAKSPPLYPAANTSVIAVSATDAQDKLFSASNRGGYIAVAAPGVDIFLPAPDNKYQMISGTSFSAAYVSGLAALMLERNPGLKPVEVRAILMKTARDLGPAGRDDLFGAGEADAYAAVQAAAAPAVPVAGGSSPPAVKSAPDQQDAPATRGLEQPASATLASGKPADGDPKPAAQ